MHRTLDWCAFPPWSIAITEKPSFLRADERAAEPAQISIHTASGSGNSFGLGKLVGIGIGEVGNSISRLVPEFG